MKDENSLSDYAEARSLRVLRYAVGILILCGAAWPPYGSLFNITSQSGPSGLTGWHWWPLRGYSGLLLNYVSILGVAWIVWRSRRHRGTFLWSLAAFVLLFIGTEVCVGWVFPEAHVLAALRHAGSGVEADRIMARIDVPTSLYRDLKLFAYFTLLAPAMTDRMRKRAAKKAAAGQH